MSGALSTRTVEKPWGRGVLPTPFRDVAGQKIGEIWFEPPPDLPQLLVKYIFTSEALSVQVHPTDAQTEARGLGRQGKEECWLILDAQPGAKLGIGFRDTITPDAMRKAAIDGSIEHKLAWHTVRSGDFFYIPANTVHAIGAGVSLIEVQQNSDITYRLYDYGRPRELHLDEGMAVARGEPYGEEWRDHVAIAQNKALVDGPLFRLDQVVRDPQPDVAAKYGNRPLLLIPRDGPVHIGTQEIAPGGCGMARSLDDVTFSSSTCLLAQPCAA